MHLGADFPKVSFRGQAMRHCILTAGVLSLAGIVCTANPLFADVVLLRSGGEIRGEILENDRDLEKSPQVTVRTLTGATISVSRNQVESLTRRRLVLEEYESLRRATLDTVDAQWNLAEWCRERSLSRERETHLERVIQLDSEHVRAHRALGHIQHDGRWTTRDELMASRGYIKHKGKYILPQELELLEQEQRESEEEKAWYKKVRMWHGWLESDRSDRQSEGLARLQTIRDRDAVPALVRYFADDPNERIRLLYISILSQIQDEKAIGPLVMQSLKDESQLVRQAAVSGLRSERVKAMPAYVRALKNDLNVVVNRAGTALAELGDETVIPELIEALVTSHRYRYLVPESNQIGFRTDGSMVSSPGAVPLPPDIAGLLATGQLPYGVQVNQAPTPGQELRTKAVLVRRDEQNPSVLTALQLLTGQDFGYNEAAWRAWFAAQKNGIPGKGKV
jgi:hypothetical protein